MWKLEIFSKCSNVLASFQHLHQKQAGSERAWRMKCIIFSAALFFFHRRTCNASKLRVSWGCSEKRRQFKKIQLKINTLDFGKMHLFCFLIQNH